jgi:hypothetical protein
MASLNVRRQINGPYSNGGMDELVIGLVISGSTGRGFPETSGQASVGR